MSAAQKLTKKQRKGLAFRQRKGKGKADAPDLPEFDNADGDDEPQPTLGDDDSENRPTHAGKAKAIVKADDAPTPTKKRKRVEGDEPARPTKQKRNSDGKAANGEGEEEVKVSEPGKKESVKSRFILFVGNLKYTTSKDAIQQHFSACDPPPTVRLLTPKSPSTSKSKGCAFLEFSHRNALQQALKLHQSELEGRKINVELTAGGGGKSEHRINKVKERNKGLASQRTKIALKKGDGAAPEPERPQRHSTTSGVEAVPTKKRTWAVGDVDDGETHRGGKKHARGDRKRPTRTKDWSTGVNSIPVG